MSQSGIQYFLDCTKTYWLLDTVHSSLYAHILIRIFRTNSCCEVDYHIAIPSPFPKSRIQKPQTTKGYLVTGYWQNKQWKYV